MAKAAQQPPQGISNVVPRSRSIVVNVVVNNPTVFLIEDPKNLDSKVLLLTTNLRLCMGITADGMSFQVPEKNAIKSSTSQSINQSLDQVIKGSANE